MCLLREVSRCVSYKNSNVGKVQKTKIACVCVMCV